jgi:hypothetical protein
MVSYRKDTNMINLFCILVTTVIHIMHTYKEKYM